MEKNFLYKKWLEDGMIDLPDLLLYNTVDDLFFEFEGWLERNGYIVKER